MALVCPCLSAFSLGSFTNLLPVGPFPMVPANCWQGLAGEMHHAPPGDVILNIIKKAPGKGGGGMVSQVLVSQEGKERGLTYGCKIFIPGEQFH